MNEEEPTPKEYELVHRLRMGRPIFSGEIEAAILASEKFERYRTSLPEVAVGDILERWSDE
jgi:hypothetical protein